MLVSTNFSDLLEANLDIKAFPDGESYVRIPQISQYKDKEVNVLHRLYPDPDQSIFQALLILDTLKKTGSKPILVSPYLPYSRQDKIFLEGEALSSEVLCDMFRLAGATKLITLDCHFLKKEGSFEYGGLQIENISMGARLVEHAKELVNGEQIDVISPDAGASYLVAEHGGKSMEKVRGEYVEGDEAYRKIEEVKGDFDVKGRNVLILDDMISTGGTMLRAVDNIKKGGAKKVICAATHGFFLKGSLEKLKIACDHVFVTDSIPSEVSVVKFLPVLKERGLIQ
jgi:ribose-phosphate pyrophosphokinase